jgi:hypothetical protein
LEEGATWEGLKLDGRTLSEGSHRFVPDTGLEGGNKEERSLEEGDRGGHGPQGPKRHKRSRCGVITLIGDNGIFLNRHLYNS